MLLGVQGQCRKSAAPTVLLREDEMRVLYAITSDSEQDYVSDFKFVCGEPGMTSHWD